MDSNVFSAMKETHLQQLFCNCWDNVGEKSDSTYYWKIALFGKNGFLKRIEGWKGENKSRVSEVKKLLDAFEDETSFCPLGSEYLE